MRRTAFLLIVALLFLNVLGWILISTNRMTPPHRTPTVKTANYYLTDTLTTDEAIRLACYDLVILGLENQVTSPDAIAWIRLFNPDVRIVGYITSNEFPTENANRKPRPNGPWQCLQMAMKDEYYLHAPDGSPAMFWPGTESFDLTNPAAATALAHFVSRYYDWGLWDGVFYDNIWTERMEWYNDGKVDADRDGISDDMSTFTSQWIAGERLLLETTRSLIGPDRLIIANEGGDSTLGLGTIDGRMFEGFPKTIPFLPGLINRYIEACEAAPYTILHCEVNKYDQDAATFGVLTSLLGNGYVACDHGPSADPTNSSDTGYHDCFWWYPAEGLQVGKPVKAAKWLNDALIMREYDAAVVIANCTNANALFEINLSPVLPVNVALAPRSATVVWKASMPDTL